MFDFSLLPPEINSTRMYTGPGSAPLSLAAATWAGLAGELESFADGFEATLDDLHATAWYGESATAMAAAARRYLTWARATATRAAETAEHARAAASAFEAAHAATVAPAVVAANRAELLVLIATNFFGQNGAAIAANEAAYAAMWAQDAAAMHGYALASLRTLHLAPHSRAPQTTSGTPAAAQPAPPSLTGLPSIHSWLQTLNPLRKLASYQYNFNLTVADVTEFGSMIAIAARRAALPELPPALWGNYSLGGVSGAVASPVLPAPLPSASLAGANRVGGLSVPQSWTAAADGGPAGAGAPRIRLAAASQPLTRPAAGPIPPLAASPPRRGPQPAAVMKTPNRRFRMPRYVACG